MFKYIADTEIGDNEMLWEVMESLPLGNALKKFLRPKREGGMVGGNIKSWWKTRTVKEMCEKLDDKGFLWEADMLRDAAAGYAFHKRQENWQLIHSTPHAVDFSEV